MKNATSANRSGLSPLRRLTRDRLGTTAIEFALVFVLFFVFVFGIIEYALMMWRWNSAETATQMAARLAVQSDPVSGGFNSYSGVADAGLGPGQSITLADVAAFTVTCSSDGTDVTCSGSGLPAGFSADPDAEGIVTFDNVVTEIQKLLPTVTEQNVIVEYSHIGLGFAGRPGTDIVPLVTVRLTNLQFDFIILDIFLGVLRGPGGAPVTDSITMPAFTASLTGEDLDASGI